MRTLALLLVVLLVLCGVAAWLYLRATGVSALQAPSPIEEYLADHLRDWLIARAASEALPPETSDTAEHATDGHTQYGSLCAGCHGYDGRTPTTLGKSLSPRSPSLASAATQRYSDAELYVTIHDGIRMSGMPGFGGQLTSDQIWNLTHYIRTLSAGGRR
jgi:mono/diheme cytochrome c family protein